MMEQVKAFTTNPGDPRWILRIHKVEEKMRLLQVYLTHNHAYIHTQAPAPPTPSAPPQTKIKEEEEKEQEE